MAQRPDGSMRSPARPPMAGKLAGRRRTEWFPREHPPSAGLDGLGGGGELGQHLVVVAEGRLDGGGQVVGRLAPPLRPHARPVQRVEGVAGTVKRQRPLIVLDEFIVAGGAGLLQGLDGGVRPPHVPRVMLVVMQRERRVVDDRFQRIVRQVGEGVRPGSGGRGFHVVFSFLVLCATAGGGHGEAQPRPWRGSARPVRCSAGRRGGTGEPSWAPFGIALARWRAPH